MSDAERLDRNGTSSAGEVSLNEHEFAVLNAVHLKKLAATEQIAVLAGTDAASTETVLGDLANAGLVLSTDGGHMLMPEGTAAVRRYYDRHYATLRAQGSLNGWYERFEGINRRFIAAVSEWQQHGGDALMFKALDIVEQLCDALGELIPSVPRYSDYIRRFEAASNAAESGEPDFLCSPRCDSAHNIWFEFHEDILGVLGRPRDTS